MTGSTKLRQLTIKFHTELFQDRRIKGAENDYNRYAYCFFWLVLGD
jgi:hypothetical protein